MRKNDYVVIEGRTLNSDAENIFTTSLENARTYAQEAANRLGKVFVLVKVVAVFVPDNKPPGAHEA